MSDVAKIEARRAARKDAAELARATQYAIDLAALDALEVQHGDSNIARVDVPYSPDLPTMAAVRTPKPAEIKRYRSRVQPDSKGKPGDSAAAAEELAAVTVVYPEGETFAAMCEARPGLKVQLGSAAVKLALGVEESEGKG